MLKSTYVVGNVVKTNIDRYLINGEKFSWSQLGADLLTVGLELFSIKSSAKNLTAAESQSWCFVAGTLVATEMGYKAIEEIEVGDTVLAENPETGEVAYKTVLETYENETTELVHVHVNGETISATPTHPFYVNQFGWTRAADLRAGDVLVLSNGEYVVVEFVQHEILESPVKVYNFEVEDYHTYFVGESGALVHNGCKEYSDWGTFKSDNQGVRGNGGISGFLRTNKPNHSPNVKKWFNKGGTIEINDGVWTYKMKRNGQVYSGTYTKDGYVTFSDNCLCPEFPDAVSIGTFSNSRSVDYNNFIDAFKTKYDVSFVPTGYAAHHLANTTDKQMQLVDQYWHSLFTHAGGFSQK